MPTSPTIGLIDYGAGNLLSVHNALRACGVEPGLVRAPGDLAGVDKLILPGVGAFGDCVENLQRQGIWEPLRQWLDDGRPYFGICLGYQILFSSSEESPGTPGLGILPGRVVKFPTKPGLKVPHMGWNTLDLVQEHPVLERLPLGPKGRHAYFVHSYHLNAASEANVLARADYGGPVTAIVGRDTAIGTQFHPEKSQRFGLALISNFLKWKP